ncbi:MAG TPA: metallopeptidase family protein [Bacteroidota bacterium]|nr:metallopeptidase family protein [Bacteroidota bacterium]
MVQLDPEPFEELVEHAFVLLPEKFRSALENIAVLVEDYPTDEIVRSMKLPSRHHLLGLYQGVPLTKRGVWYGTSPVGPDKITLYRSNILSLCRTEADVGKKIYEVLVHEIGHYFGMDEDQIRKAGF